MQRFKNILLLLGEGSRRRTWLFNRTLALAKKNQARVTILEVHEKPPRGLGDTSDPQSRLHRFYEAQGKQLDRLVVRARQQGVTAEGKVLFGKAFLEVIRAVLRNGHDLVVLSAEGKQKTLWFGTTATHLLRKAPCPVWVTRPASKPRYQRILAALEADPDNPAGQALDKKILELAVALCRLEKPSSLHVVHAWMASGENLLRMRAGMGETEVQNYIRQVRETHTAQLREVLKSVDLTETQPQVHFLKGDPAQIIPLVAKRKRVDVIVMGTVGRMGIAGFFIGNTAERVIHQVRCAVLATKPDGFVTPVSAS